ncbi:YtpR family tRNA-binding protein [Salimicrobium halophilum]|uniref:tRNA-binding protein n=1 Tax=Salimicrobium halophilum TaxID=86666 RepID=A0A1G8VKE9_9BACI|nr:DUF4479 domain-containing protein [Salimicrobium halophilum]SDJ66473.1 tRNA-binding protein [Salimicrobium halophilum]
MNVYYNSIGVGDVLLIPLKEAEKKNRTHAVYGDVVKITDEKDGSVLGYNIFRASEHFDALENGRARMTEGMLGSMRTLFSEEGLKDNLDFDLEHKFVVGYVEEKDPHENADKLNVCQVNLGDSKAQIVCGAPNVDAGQKVVVAKVGAVMPSGMKIKDAELRGVPSSGMICSAKELQLPDAPEEKGILVLDDSYEVGEPFHF